MSIPQAVMLGRQPKPQAQATEEHSQIVTQSPSADPGIHDGGSYHSRKARVPDEAVSAEDEAEVQDPMVCVPICPFVIPMTLKHLRMGKEVHQGALIDTGCTHCLLQRSIVDNMGLHVVQLRKPIVFEQMDGSTLGGQPATRYDLNSDNIGN